MRDWCFEVSTYASVSLPAKVFGSQERSSFLPASHLARKAEQPFFGHGGLGDFRLAARSSRHRFCTPFLSRKSSPLIRLEISLISKFEEVVRSPGSTRNWKGGWWSSTNQGPCQVQSKPEAGRGSRKPGRTTYGTEEGRCGCVLPFMGPVSPSACSEQAASQRA